MKIEANSPTDYISQLPDERQSAMTKLRQTILDNLPEGFEETMIYGMIGYVVPKSIYPAGYHCDPSLPLTFINIASQKNFIAIYHLGIYMIPDLLNWFVNEYPKHSSLKLDMGKGCIRFKKIDQIPYNLIAELIRKISCNQYLEIYTNNLKR